MKEVKRTVSTGFWNDDKVLNDFSPEDKYFMLYLLTNPYTAQLGVYHLPLKKAALELGYSLDAVNVLLDRFERKYKMIHFNNHTSEVAIKNFLRYSIVKGGKPVNDCLEKELKGVKDLSLVAYVFKNIKDNTVDINNTVLEFIDNHIDILNIYKENDIYNDNENERIVPRIVPRIVKSDKYTEEIHIIIDYLNNICGTHYKYGENSAKHIRARLKEGFTVDDFKTVIDKKNSDWKDNDEMVAYLRPQTLFSAEHFESYLNQKEKKGEKNDRAVGKVSGVKQKFSEEDIEQFRRELGM